MIKIGSNEFDVVLAYGGPLSYVLQNRYNAVMECRRILKENGLSNLIKIDGHALLLGVDIYIIIKLANNFTSSVSPNAFSFFSQWMMNIKNPPAKYFSRKACFIFVLPVPKFWETILTKSSILDKKRYSRL